MTQVKSSLSLKNYLSFSNEILEARVNVGIRTTWMLMSSVGFKSFFFFIEKRRVLSLCFFAAAVDYSFDSNQFLCQRKNVKIFLQKIYSGVARFFFHSVKTKIPFFSARPMINIFFVMNKCQRRQEGIKTVVCSDWKMFISRLNERKKSDGHLNHFFESARSQILGCEAFNSWIQKSR